MRRHELSDDEWRVIAPLLPQNSRGVARVDGRPVINGILWLFRAGSSWRDVPERYGPAHDPLQPHHALAGSRRLGSTVGSGKLRLRW